MNLSIIDQNNVPGLKRALTTWHISLQLITAESL